MRATNKRRPRARPGLRAILDAATNIARLLVGAAAAVTLSAAVTLAADYPTPKEADFVAHGFRFHTGEVMPELRLHYTTIGAPSGNRC